MPSATSYMVVPEAVAQTFAPAAITASAWIRPTTLVSFLGAITRQFGTGMQNDLYLGTNNTVVAGYCEIAPATELGTNGGTVITNAWSYLVMTADANMLRMYLDGTEVASTATGGPLVADTNAIFLGAECNGACPADTPSTSYFDGLIDEARLERVARTPSWIAYSYAAMNDAVISY
jgi:hypothetical protein